MGNEASKRVAENANEWISVGSDGVVRPASPETGTHVSKAAYDKLKAKNERIYQKFRTMLKMKHTDSNTPESAGRGVIALDEIVVRNGLLYTHELVEVYGMTREQALGDVLEWLQADEQRAPHHELRRLYNHGSGWVAEVEVHMQRPNPIVVAEEVEDV